RIHRVGFVELLLVEPFAIGAPGVFFVMVRHPAFVILFPYTTLFRSPLEGVQRPARGDPPAPRLPDRVVRRRARHAGGEAARGGRDRKSTRLNSSHVEISYAVFCLKKKRGRRWISTSYRGWAEWCRDD